MGVKASGDSALGAENPSPAPAATTVVITGVSGFLGQAVLRRLAGSPAVGKLVGLDVREPGFRPRGLQFHLVDVAGSDLRPLFEGVDVLVHLAGVHDAIPDEDLMARVNVGGTRRVLEAAAAAGVSKVVLVSSAAVYGAWPNNPIPLTEDAPLRPNPGFPLGRPQGGAGAAAGRVGAEPGRRSPPPCCGRRSCSAPGPTTPSPASSGPGSR